MKICSVCLEPKRRKKNVGIGPPTSRPENLSLLHACGFSYKKDYIEIYSIYPILYAIYYPPYYLIHTI
jgi:hypothetical protein